MQTALDAIAGGGRRLVDDSLTYTGDHFTVDPVVVPGAAGLEVVVGARNSVPAR